MLLHPLENFARLCPPMKSLRMPMLSRCQFHQHFYVQIFRTNVVWAAFSSYVSALVAKFRTKNARVNVDEIVSRG